MIFKFKFGPTARSSRTLLLTALTTAILAFGAASASAAVQLKWTDVNVYAGSCSTTMINCTWIGHLTRAGHAGVPDGVVEPIAPATGPTLNAASPKGVDQIHTWSFDASAGSINTQTMAGTLSFTGGLRLDGMNHCISQTVEEPRIVLNGDDTGQLFASGDKADNAMITTPGCLATEPRPTEVIPYDDSSPLFNLDLSDAVCTLNWDGTETYGPIAPSIATAGHAYPASYGVGTGPDRSPNTFGTFSLTGVVCSGRSGTDGTDGAQGPTGAQGAEGPAGPQGIQGPAGKDGSNGKDGKDATIRTIKLTKAVFGKKAVVAKITRKGKVYGYAEIKGKRAKLTSVVELKGKYVLKTLGKKSRKATVKLG